MAGDTEIKTARLVLRRFRDGDLTDVAALIRDKMASPYAPYDIQWPTADETMKDILGYFMCDDSWYAVELAREKRVIGFVSANRADTPETRNLGYTIHSDYKNNGYAYEACVALIGHCKTDLGVKVFVAGTADCNIPSVKLLFKLRFLKVQSFEASFAANADGSPITFGAGRYQLTL